MPRVLVTCLLALVLVLVGVGAGAGTDRSAAPPGPAVERISAARARIDRRKPRPVPLGERAVRIALHALGRPYRWGGAGPSGFDCSGLVRWAYGRAGVTLPHNAWAQSRLGRPVERGRLRPGDLVFFHGYGHVGIYIGRGRMVHAPQSGERVRITALTGRHGRRVEAARRLRLA